MSEHSYRSAADDAQQAEPALAGPDIEANEADAAEQRQAASVDESGPSYTRPLPDDADPADAWDQDREVQLDDEDDYR